jgi:hypothetical protein
LVLTVLVFVPISSQAATVIFEGNTATGIQDVPCGDVFFDITFVFQTGHSLYGDPGDFPFKGASGDLEASNEEQTYFCSRAIQTLLNESPVAITRVGPQNSSYFLIAADEEQEEPESPLIVYGGFESRYYDTVDETVVQRPPQTWVPADNWFLNIDLFTGEDIIDVSISPFPFGSRSFERDVPLSYAKIEPAAGSPPPADDTVGGSVTGLLGDGLVLQNNGADDEPIAADGAFTFNTLLTVGTSYSVAVKTQPSNPAQRCTVARGWGSVLDGGVSDVLVTCTDVPVSRTSFLPAVYQLLLLND